MSWTGPSTCFTARACRADPCRFTARAYRFTARERCVQTRAAKIHVACKRGMDRSYVAPVSPRVRAVQTLAAQIHAACRRHFSKGSAAGRLASERRARMSWTGPSTCFTARACCADPCRFTARAYRFTARERCVQTRAAKIHVACKRGMDRSYVAPVSPRVRAVQTLAAQIHAAPGQ